MRSAKARLLGWSPTAFLKNLHLKPRFEPNFKENKPSRQQVPTPVAMKKIANNKSITTGLLLALCGSIAFSGKAIIVKLAYRYGVDAVTLIMFRMLFAFPVFALMAWWASRGKAALAWRDWLGVLWLGFTGYYLASFLDFAGLAYISASLERLILYLNPTLVMLLGFVLYKRRVLARQLAGTAISYCGVVLVFGHELTLQGVSQRADTAWGALLIFLSAVSYAVYLVYSGEMVKRLGALRLVGLVSTVACVLCILQFVLLRPLSAAQAVSPEVIWLSLLNATLCTVAPVLMVMMAIERIGASMAAQTGMVGPMSTILMGVLILGEPFTAWVGAGTVLVIAGIFVFSRARA
jgi:drug/metabolite transporter (DMT)-like permease